MAQKSIKLSDDDIAALTRMVYGEAAGEDYNTMKMVAQSAVNRLRSGRKKEFGSNLSKVLQKGYYAVSNPNQPYKQALYGNFNNELSKKKWQQAQKAVSDMIAKQDFGEAMFYFTPDEITKLQKGGKFNFSVVKPTGKVGKFLTFAYPIQVPHYQGE